MLMMQTIRGEIRQCFNFLEITGSAVAILKWELAQKVSWTSQPDAEELFDVYVKTVDGRVRISAMGSDYDLRLNERYGILNSFVDTFRLQKRVTCAPSRQKRVITTAGKPTERMGSTRSVE